MEEAWNIKIADEFNPSLINALYKGMMGWFNKYATNFMYAGH